MRKEISRYYWLILLMGFCFLLLGLGCDTKPAYKGFTDFDYYWAVDYCAGCSRQLDFVVHDDNDEGSYYYWLEMKDMSGKIITHGPADDTFTPPCWIHAKLTIGYYLDNLPSGNYQFKIHMCDNVTHVGDASKSIAFTSDLIYYVDMTNSLSDIACQADHCCHNIGRQYVQAQRDIDYITGVSAYIKTRYGKPCKYSSSYRDAFNVVYCGIFSNNGKNAGQIGFGYERNPSFWNVDTAVQYWYNETLYEGIRVNFDHCTWDSTDKIPVTPSESMIYGYKCELDAFNGIWYYMITNQFGFEDTVNIYPDSRFNHLGKNVTWSGEIYNYEDDMAGTSLDRCEISDLKYRISGNNYQSFQLTDNDLSTTEPSHAHWMFNKVDGTAFEIWDVIPQ